MTRIRPVHAITDASNRERLLWAVRVRWLAIGGFSVLALLAWSAGVLTSIRPSAVAAVTSLGLNALNHWAVVRWRHVAAVSLLAIPADVILITYLIVHTGGAHSPFLMLYVVQVVATAMLVDLAVAAAGALASATCFLVALWLQPTELAPLAPVPLGVSYQVIWGLFLLYCLALLTYLGGYIAERLRRSEDDLAERNERLRATLASLSTANAELHDTVARLQTTEAQLVQSEKMRALGQFVAGIAHELNNPIGFVCANLEYVRRAVEAIGGTLAAYRDATAGAPAQAAVEARCGGLRVDAFARELPSVLDDCEEGARRAAEIVSALRDFARQDRPDAWSHVDLAERLDRTLALLRHRTRAGMTVHREFGPVPPVPCCPGQVDQVLLNLLTNAIDAIADDGTIWVRTAVAPAPAGAPRRGLHALVGVRDDGPGISPEIRDRLFEPFFTTKSEGQGTGLGLTVSYAIVERHGGTIAVDSRPGSGTEFVVYLPLQREPSALDSIDAAPSPNCA